VETFKESIGGERIAFGALDRRAVAHRVTAPPVRWLWRGARAWADWPATWAQEWS